MLRFEVQKIARVAGLVAALWGAMLMQSTAALAVTSVSPITISDCRIKNSRSYVSAYRPVIVEFTNQRAMSVDEIRFTVEYAGHTEHIVDKGTFAQNVKIDHAFNGFYNELYYDESPSCSVDYIEYADGTVWTASSPSPAPKGSLGTA